MCGGNVIHFISKIENLDFRETLEFLADRSGITLPTLENSEDSKKQYLKDQIYKINEQAANFYHENLYQPQSKKAQEYVKQRKLDNKTLKAFRIGAAGNFNELYLYLKSQGFKDEEILASGLASKNDNNQFIDRFRKRLMIPITNIRGKVIAFGGRILDNEAKTAKYINSSENLIYTKGRHLFGMNLAKNTKSNKIIVVEGYMDAISLYQRGIDNVVASLGTALTEAQGRLLRKYGEQIIIGYDSDGAGQAATIRGLNILRNMGCDVRILQIEGAKDPDEFIVKYGSGRFNLLVEKAISFVEFKIKMIKEKYQLENTNDKIKFLNEIAKVLSEVDNNIEKEVYIEKISDTYKISKEAIYAEVNKIEYKHSSEKILSKTIAVKRKEPNQTSNKITTKRENMILYLMINERENAYPILKEYFKVEDFKNEVNRKIASTLFQEYEKGNYDVAQILNSFVEDDVVNQLSQIMVEDYEITSVEKCIEDVVNSYTKERYIERKNEIVSKMKENSLSKDEVSMLEKELSELIIKLAKMK